jgi:hypothetical protein
MGISLATRHYISRIPSIYDQSENGRGRICVFEASSLVRLDLRHVLASELTARMNWQRYLGITRILNVTYPFGAVYIL